MDDKLSTIILDIEREYGNEIYLDIPKNRFTKYKSVFYPSIGLDQEKINEIMEQEAKSIWITSDSEKPKLFYEWTGTYFKELFKFKNVKYLIYINKNNDALHTKFMSVENSIKDFVNNI
ncbi:unnamed protein product [marine sediment metagenome]|uniref:Uncharacterized protein n=1 Tax=marine sediment metagenome TaxID=412755 RepID=X1HBZ2_9ZZZZ